MIRIRDYGHPTHYCFESWPSEPVQHAIFGRDGGVSQAQWATLNVGHTVGDDPDHVDENHARIYAGLGIDATQIVTAQQVAGDRVALVTEAKAGKVIPATDGLITDRPGLYLMLRFADCVPILLWDPAKRAVGLVHAGWRGTVKGIAALAAQRMIQAFGTDPADLHAGIGPSIGPCCFEVGPEVVAAFEVAFSEDDGVIASRLPQGKALVDLWRANAAQLERTGVTQIEIGGPCTQCQHEQFFSHRADRGATGRFAALIGLRSS